MPDFDTLADGLIQETLLDMADSFFGARTSLEQEIERFETQAKALKKQRDEALSRADLLHALLLTQELAHEFYFSLGVHPKAFFAQVDPSRPLPPFKRPRALTRRGRFVKAVLKAYDAMQREFDAYMEGRYYADPRKPGRKRLSMHYRLMVDWAGHVNRRIRQVNEGQAPSCVLAFAKSLNVENVAKERITDAPLDRGGIECSLDQELAFKPVSCMDLGIRELPELPLLATVKRKVARHARQIYRSHKAQARQAMQGLPKPANNSAS